MRDDRRTFRRDNTKSLPFTVVQSDKESLSGCSESEGL